LAQSLKNTSLLVPKVIGLVVVAHAGTSEPSTDESTLLGSAEDGITSGASGVMDIGGR
jgi:hypothetical protein